MDWKKVGKTLLFPPLAVLLCLLPLGSAFLIASMRTLEETDPLRLLSYLLAFYTVTLWCARLPRLVRLIRQFKENNRYAKRWFSDAHLRTNVTLSGHVLWNGAYGALQLGLGVYHRSAWSYSLAAYYACLAAMRLFLVRHTLHHEPGKEQKQELLRYRTCGWVFLLLNLALSAMIFYLIRQNRTVQYHEITTIALAAYTFTSLTLAIINVIRYRTYNSPAMSAAKAISLASACVSMLTLEDTMLATFRGADMTPQTHRLFLALSGGAVSVFVVVMAMYMIVQANQKLKTFGG